MFRIVVKSNLTMSLARNLKEQFEFTLPTLDGLQDGYASMHSARQAMQVAKEMSADKMPAAVGVIRAAQKWSNLRKSSKEKILGIDLATLEAEMEGEAPSASAAERNKKMSKLIRYRRNSVHQVC